MGWLKAYSKKYEVDIQAWVLMTNHVHLLCTPKTNNAISQMMQSLGRSYVRYFNLTYKRSGSFWEGRYKSCLIQQEDYLLYVSRYIELNPVRAGMVDEPADYFWSSYQINALGENSDLWPPHPLYLALDKNASQRQAAYRALFVHHLDGKLLEVIRTASNKGIAIGSDQFKDEIEELTGRRVKSVKVGRRIG